jgi:hypothetical protein
MHGFQNVGASLYRDISALRMSGLLNRGVNPLLQRLVRHSLRG